MSDGPSTRKGPIDQNQDVRYNPIFPDPEGNVRRPDNVAARAKIGDNGIKQTIRDSEAQDAQDDLRRRQHSDHNN